MRRARQFTGCQSRAVWAAQTSHEEDSSTCLPTELNGQIIFCADSSTSVRVLPQLGSTVVVRFTRVASKITPIAAAIHLALLR